MQNRRTASQGWAVRTFTPVLTALTCLFLSTPAMAAVTLPSLFGDHMVVQRNMEVPIWGTDTANQSVTVKLGTQQATATTGSDGKWTAAPQDGRQVRDHQVWFMDLHRQH